VSVNIELEDQGTPRLLGADAPALDPESSIPPESPLPEIEVVWTPEEAQGVLQTVLNFGVFFYGPQWLCGPGDFLRSAPNAARLMERVFPKATTGGVVGIGIDAAAVASDFGASIASRRELMRKGPKKGEQVLAEFGLAPEPRPAPPDQYAPSAPPAQPVPAGDSQPTESSSFKFTPQVAAALRNAAPGTDLGAMGMGF
jgi:hypothetical protein